MSQIKTDKGVTIMEELTGKGEVKDITLKKSAKIKKSAAGSGGKQPTVNTASLFKKAQTTEDMLNIWVNHGA